MQIEFLWQFKFETFCNVIYTCIHTFGALGRSIKNNIAKMIFHVPICISKVSKKSEPALNKDFVRNNFYLKIFLVLHSTD